MEAGRRRLRRNKVALFFGGVFLLIVILCLLAPVYSHDIAHISPDYAEHRRLEAQQVPADLRPITGHPDRADLDTSHYFFGADEPGT